MPFIKGRNIKLFLLSGRYFYVGKSYYFLFHYSLKVQLRRKVVRERSGFSAFSFGVFRSGEAVLLSLYIEIVLLSVC